MIENLQPGRYDAFILPAYGLTVLVLIVLVGIGLWRARYWKSRT